MKSLEELIREHDLQERVCTCAVCVRDNEYREMIGRVTDPEASQFFTKLFDDFRSVEFDFDYYSAILNGTWPNAVSLLYAAIEKAEAHQIAQNKRHGTENQS